MIRSLRILTRLLGKVGFRRFIHDNDLVYARSPSGFPKSRPPWQTERYTYGLGLKETKDLVERYLDVRSRKSKGTES